MKTKFIYSFLIFLSLFMAQHGNCEQDPVGHGQIYYWHYRYGLRTRNEILVTTFQMDGKIRSIGKNKRKVYCILDPEISQTVEKWLKINDDEWKRNKGLCLKKESKSKFRKTFSIGENVIFSTNCYSLHLHCPSNKTDTASKNTGDEDGSLPPIPSKEGSNQNDNNEVIFDRPLPPLPDSQEGCPVNSGVPCSDIQQGILNKNEKAGLPPELIEQIRKGKQLKKTTPQRSSPKEEKAK